MYTILLGLFLGLVGGFVLGWIGEEYDRGFVGVGYGILGAVMGAGAGLVIALVIGGLTGVSYRVASTSNLAALRDGTAAQGGFFLGSGVVDQQLKYYYYEQVGDGGLKARSVDADYATVYQGDGTPHIEYLQPWSKWDHWAATIGNDHYNIYIPANSLKTGYTLDLGATK